MISNFKFQISNLFIWIALMLLLFGSPVFASETITGYAWSENIGWINFGCSNCNAQISDTALTGYAWNENTGRILLNPDNSGVTNTIHGILAGYAWAEGVGWINFAGIRINSEGRFTGHATGDNTGDVNFNCDYCNVQSNWTPAGGSPGGESVPPFNPDTPAPAPSEPVIPADAGIQSEGEDVDSGFRQNDKPSIVDKIKEKITDFLPDFLKPKKEPPELVVTVPKLPPLSLRGGWEYLDPEPIKRFALAPLPKELAVLKEKLPQIEKLFTSTGVEKMTDVQKIKDSRLSLPGLTETIAFSMPAITTGKFSQTKAVPLTQLTTPAKNRIPSDIVFVKAGGGMIDYNIALSLNTQGKTQQKIAAVSGQSMEFIVKPDKPVKRIVGYIVFKSKKPKEPSFNVPLNKLAVSAIMQNPEFVMPAALSLSIPVEGSSPVIPAEAGIQSEGEIETRLVLLKFEYEDTGNGVYSATAQMPVVEGEYEVITVMEYEDATLPQKEIRLITVVDPEGYVYKKSGDLESRVPGAVVYLYWLNSETKQYELWPSTEYQQENPQATGPSGTYSFLVPNGYYYLKVDTPGYLSYDGKPFQVTEGSGVHINIELKTRYWWLGLVNWQTVLLVLMAGLLLYNFYKDRKREKIK